MPILAIAVTTIDCDGHDGTPCPDNTVVEFPHPQSVAIRLAKQSGWTVWIETMCPECTSVQAAAAAPTPLDLPPVTVDAIVPALMVLAADAGEDATGWCARMKAERRQLVGA
ncbi:hypothetical protein GCM10023063_16780 [Arthrobacter methylotrophus]|uniref:Uncharacterized protein n=1 Tax=Arthrobacter methylotrophus TaxID=121291 RepID=A0ABV5UNK2_9MICC